MGGLRCGRAAGLTPLVVLGCTGSIGTQALDVADELGLPVRGLASGTVSASLIEIAGRYPDAMVAVADAGARDLLPSHLTSRVAFGDEAVADLASRPATTVVNGIVGSAGLAPTVAALRAGNRVALANKETLVAGGPVVTAAVSRPDQLIPVDSEHAAVWQLTVGKDPDTVEQVILTASGGPFRGRTRQELETVTVAEALAHPTWDMGPRITVDSATLTNKALEVIEAHFLFGVGFDDIEVVVHPQSIVHSMVRFADGTVEAVLGPPDMRVPIRQAITWPARVHPAGTPWSPVGTTLEFFAPDRDTFPALDLGFRAGKAGGSAPAVLNAADEVAVAAFLEERISFPAIPEVVTAVLDRFEHRDVTTVDEVLAADAEARSLASDEVARAAR